MQAVIRGKIYDTETATKLCQVWWKPGRSADLYKTPKGAFFLFMPEVAMNSTGQAFMVVDFAQARHYAETEMPLAELQAHFPIEVA